jgi:ribosomal protein S18 acetylase RimI-like enzyme
MLDALFYVVDHGVKRQVIENRDRDVAFRGGCMAGKARDVPGAATACCRPLPPPERARQYEAVITQISRDDLSLLERAVTHFRGVQKADVVRAFGDTPSALAFVASDETEIFGWCWGHHLARPDSSSMLYVHQLEVAESHRRRDVGRDLLRAFMGAGAKAGATKMFLTTGEANVAARSLYESLGGGLATQGPTVNYWFLLGPHLG